MYKVQEVAKIAGVSVRTLHHYDSIGLLKPSNIGTNRYRYYNGEDLKLLQQILFLKELDFSLKKIQELVADGFDRDYALSQHIELLEQKKQRIEKLIQNAERTQQELQGSESLTDTERFSAFASSKSEDLIKRYQQAEVGLSDWAHAEPPVETFEAMSGYGGESAVAVAVAPVGTALHEEPAADNSEQVKPEKEEEDLDEINREGDRIYNTVANLMHLPPQTDAVQQEMKAYYTLLNRFYDCSPKMFRGLGDLYASDSRFANNIDQHGQGLAKYLKEAMDVYAERLQDA